MLFCTSCVDRRSSAKGTRSTADLASITEAGGEPGTFGLQLNHNDVEREAIVYVPESYDAGVSTALMLNFHGFDGSAADHLQWADMRDLADRDGHIVVYPQGTRLDGSSHWNAALPGDDNKSEADDLNFVPELVAFIAETYPYDEERVYASGYSNGGMMAAALGCYRSDLIAGVGIVSGTQLDTGGTCVPSHPTAVITLHGTDDSVLPYDGSEEVPSAQSAIDFWVEYNQTDRVPTVETVADGSIRIERSVYGGGRSGVSVEHYRYEGGGHEWFEDAFNGSSASELVWNAAILYSTQGAL